MTPDPDPVDDANTASASLGRHRRDLRALLAAYAHGNPDEILPLRNLIGGLGRRAFGMLLLIATLPAFIPIPVGGAVAGPLVMLIGMQLLAGRRRPWLPQFIASRGPHRGSLARFNARILPWLARLEHLIKPRGSALLVHRAAWLLTGLLLTLLGLLLSLPIPLTNYPLGMVILLFALAMLERDGHAMVVAWIVGIVAITAFGVLSGSLVTFAQGAIQRWF